MLFYIKSTIKTINLIKFATIIKTGGIVAFPTETVYGLGANAFNPIAVQKIYDAKRRPADNPLIVHLADITWLDIVANKLTDLEIKLFKTFSPGPLTLLIPKNNNIPNIVTAGSKLVGVRIPNHKIAIDFIHLSGVPIAAPSANISGKPSATHHKHVINAFGNSIPVIKGGASKYGVESTVVKVENDKIIYILRQGAISKEDIKQAFPNVKIKIAGDEISSIKASPGTRYRHYAPKAKIIIVPYTQVKQMAEEINNILNSINPKEKIALFCSKELIRLLKNKKKKIVYNIGSLQNAKEALSKLYSNLIDSDNQNIDLIITHLYPDTGSGLTYNERIYRAGGK